MRSGRPASSWSARLRSRSTPRGHDHHRHAIRTLATLIQLDMHSAAGNQAAVALMIRVPRRCRVLSTVAPQREEDAMADTVVFPGQVEWSGENPGISLKQQADGPFTTLASFFRVVLSPHGRGHALVLLRSPQEAEPAPERANVCLHDNEPLARYLVSEFV